MNFYKSIIFYIESLDLIISYTFILSLYLAFIFYFFIIIISKLYLKTISMFLSAYSFNIENDNKLLFFQHKKTFANLLQDS